MENNIKYTYEENKEYMKDIRIFFESLDLTQLTKEDLSKIDMLKEEWTEYYFKYLSPSSSLASEEMITKTVDLFTLSNSIEDKNNKNELLDFTYSYIALLKDEYIFSFSEKEGIDNKLNKVGLLTIDKYFEEKKEKENSNNQKKIGEILV